MTFLPVDFSTALIVFSLSCFCRIVFLCSACNVLPCPSWLTPCLFQDDACCSLAPLVVRTRDIEERRVFSKLYIRISPALSSSLSPPTYHTVELQHQSELLELVGVNPFPPCSGVKRGLRTVGYSPGSLMTCHTCHRLASTSLSHSPTCPLHLTFYSTKSYLPARSMLCHASRPCSVPSILYVLGPISFLTCPSQTCVCVTFWPPLLLFRHGKHVHCCTY